MSVWFNYVAAAKILVFGVLVGAAIPATFALGVRINAEGSGATTAIRLRPGLIALSWLIFAVVLVAVIIGVLFVARDFIGHHTGWFIFGAKHK